MEICSIFPVEPFFDNSLLLGDFKIVEDAACDPIGENRNHEKLEESCGPSILNSAGQSVEEGKHCLSSFALAAKHSTRSALLV